MGYSLVKSANDMFETRPSNVYSWIQTEINIDYNHISYEKQLKYVIHDTNPTTQRVIAMESMNNHKHILIYAIIPIPEITGQAQFKLLKPRL